MTWWHTHPDAAAIVRKHWREAELLVIAQRQPCIGIRRDELAKIDRVVLAVGLQELRAWVKRSKPRKSWLVAVLLCRGDDTAELAAIVKDLGLDATRFHFYLHKDAKVGTLAGWADAGLSLDAVDEGITGWVMLHKILGIDFNVQIVNDAIQTEK
jgi:hypothetical protein